MDAVKSQLLELLERLPVSKWGIGDISGTHPMAEEFPRAISFLVAYRPCFREYDEAAYEKLLIDTRTEAKRSMAVLREKLDELGIRHYAVGAVGQSEDTLTGDFPLKLAATRAGLGWVGKNGLLVTEEFGPRVRLEAVLVDLDLPAAEPVTQSRCGSCRVCVDACPYRCLTGAEWRPGVQRTTLIDAFACRDERSRFEPVLGRRHACG